LLGKTTVGEKIIENLKNDDFVKLKRNNANGT
jgi:hypothetical protein